MNLLIKSATITDPSSKLHGKKRDILIENGKITKIAVKITNSNQTKEFTAADLHVSKGWQWGKDRQDVVWLNLLETLQQICCQSPDWYSDLNQQP